MRLGGGQVGDPVESELPGDPSLVRHEDGQPVIEPGHPRGLVALLATLEPIHDAFPDVDATLLPLAPFIKGRAEPQQEWIVDELSAAGC